MKNILNNKNKPKNSWKQLERALCSWLSEFSSSKIKFRNSNQAIVGFPSNGFRSDGMLTNGKVLFAIEVEAGQTHPDTNTGKYWLLHKEYKQYEKIILFHIYTPDFNSYGWRKRLGKFYIEQMEKMGIQIDYIKKEYSSESNYDEVFKELKQLIKEKLDSSIFKE